MRRLLPAVLALGLVACDGTKDKPASGDSAPTAVGTIAPPVACPVGELLLTQGQIDEDLALLQLWNDVRLAGGSCGSTAMDATNALQEQAPLSWVARCWALDISLNGPPAVEETFSDGTTLRTAAEAQGFQGIVNGWGIQGGQPDPEAALQDWIDDGDAGCERLWADALIGAFGISSASETLIVTRLSAFGPG